MIEFLPQCCDADSYIGIGYQCAINSAKCYTNLRPMGASYWFSLPHRLGVPLVSLLYVNIFLLLSSVLLSVFSLTRVYKRENISRNYLMVSILVSLVIHWVWVAPAMFYSLIDVPAGLLLLIGLWLLIGWGKSNMTLFLLAITCFSVVPVMRSFYLYPIVIALVIYLILFVIDKNRNYKSILLLFILAPAAFQFYETYDRTGDISFINSSQSEKWTEIHLQSHSMGFDTLLVGPYNEPNLRLEDRLVHRKHLPESYAGDDFYSGNIVRSKVAVKYWKSTCGPLGLKTSLEELQLLTSVCIISKRIYFYLGSYSDSVYMETDKSRTFSWLFMVLNSMSVLSLLVTLWLFKLKTKELVFSTTILLLCFLQALVIIPEQRFILVVLVFSWINFYCLMTLAPRKYYEAILKLFSK